jgi:oligopeptide transport system ATP-binding protein
MSKILEVTDLVTKFYTLDGVVHAVNGVSFDLERRRDVGHRRRERQRQERDHDVAPGPDPHAAGQDRGGEASFTTAEGRETCSSCRSDELRNVRGGQIGFVFQDPISTLNPILTIGEQISETLTRHLKLSRSKPGKRAIELLGRSASPTRRCATKPTLSSSRVACASG